MVLIARKFCRGLDDAWCRGRQFSLLPNCGRGPLEGEVFQSWHICASNSDGVGGGRYIVASTKVCNVGGADIRLGQLYGRRRPLLDAPQHPLADRLRQAAWPGRQRRGARLAGELREDAELALQL